MTTANSELDREHQEQMFIYLQSLENFFKVTGINHDRSKSARAQKARLKLIKLSALQFYELSTDVFDELNRRISEDQTKPNYLLPKVNFHLKRNQARQKLANLSQTRFNDLIDDILYEIRRRGMGYNPNEINSFISNDDNISKSSNLNLIAPTIGLQESEIVPKKASIDWSTEEEEESESHKNIHKLYTGDFDTITSEKDILNKSHHGNTIKSSPLIQETSMKFNQPAFDLNSSPEQRQQKHDNNNNDNTNNTNNTNNSKNNNNNDNTTTTISINDDTTTLEPTIAKVVNVQEIIPPKPSMNIKTNHQQHLPFNAYDINYKNEITSLSDQVSKLSIENEKLNQMIAELKLEPGIELIHSSKDMLTRLSKKYPLDKNALEMYISNDGHVPITILLKINGLINSFFEQLIQRNPDSIGKYLFEILYQLSNLVYELLLRTDFPIYKDQIVLLKASYSHLITSVRYYSIYSSILPQVTVQAAVTEFSYSVCNLIHHAKLIDDDNSDHDQDTTAGDFNSSVVHRGFEHHSNINGANLHESNSPFSTQKILSSLTTSGNYNEMNGNNYDKSLDKKNEGAEEDDNDDFELSPVKPLKILQKATMNMNPSSSSSARKISSAGVMPSLLDASRSKSQLNIHLENGRSTNTENSVPTIEKRSLKIISDVSASNGDINKGLKELEKNNDYDIKEDVNKSVKVISPTKVELSTEEEKELNKSDAQVDTSLQSQTLYNDSNAISIEDSSMAKMDSKLINEAAVSKNTKNKTITEDPETSTQVFTDKMKKFNNSIGIGFRMASPNDDTKKLESNVKKNDEIKGDPKVVPMERSVKREPTIPKYKAEESKLTAKMKQVLEVDDDLPVVSKGTDEVTEVPVVVEKDIAVDEPVVVEKPVAIKKPVIIEEDLNAAPDVVKANVQRAERNKMDRQEAADDDEEEEESESEFETGSESEEEFDIDAFDIENPDNTLRELLLYLEHQTVEVISTIQSLLSSIKQPKSTNGKLRIESNAINQVIGQMVEATTISMNQSRNAGLKEHGNWVVQSLSDCRRRMTMLCDLKPDGKFISSIKDTEFADKNFKQRLAGIAFDVANVQKS
ncbi:hypothetical protein Kpol_1041p1 [Vanderwaltozyma polyspora DSM 70294]|uniref:GIT Spa2 homology (SHD) domain-containing protein n=1 Tax=Vanderwaltozyma polyspora (strain ATCC 22028 / DSM 70294 / BCRC 21397 / CBS 2163 / NBRC 10782 / NRRL Y-8283 / UCD 57-17) TaxID=436907 RepID=A7TL69_VANPO|nr:uncharacterized protein Kpol_1041p1 [Vanderwaltozyma polyspora DSM 70294]EDO16944.1 hypothetical protein Kpol_1041p1 [Vanderwaltozyma polyspora DSM 70294]